MSIDTLPPDEVRRIAEQRLRDREAGRPLTPVAPGAAAAPELTPDEQDAADRRLEKQEQAEVRKVFLAFGARVYWLSQARRTGQTPGLPDLWVFLPKHELALWWETKAKGGRLRPEQEEFRELCHVTRVLHGVGGRRDAEELLIGLGIARRAPSGNIEHIRHDP